MTEILCVFSFLTLAQGYIVIERKYNNLKIKKRNCAEMALLLYIGYAFFSDLISALLGISLFRYGLWGLSLLLLFIAVLHNGKIYFTKAMFALMCIIFAFVIMRNQAFLHSDYITTFRWLYSIFFGVLAVWLTSSWEKTIRFVAIIGFVYVIATYVFWLIPSLYNNMYSVWGYWPSGTSYGSSGYKAGLTNHYSHNGIVLTATYLALFSIVFAYRSYSKNNVLPKRKRNVIVFSIMFFLALWAVIMTKKRAHSLFGIISMVSVYYFCQPKKVGGKTFKLIVVGISAVIVLGAASNFVPQISGLLERFSFSIDEDSTMQSRFQFWRLAINMFINKPILGYGWFGFRYKYNLYLYDPSIRSARYRLLDCHNVYLQILAETGLVGFVLYMTITVYFFVNTFSMIRKNSDVINQLHMEIPLIFSACMQVFYLLYSLTGNCLYDITSAFYIMAIAIAASCKLRVKHSKKQSGVIT